MSIQLGEIILWVLGFCTLQPMTREGRNTAVLLITLLKSGILSAFHTHFCLILPLCSWTLWLVLAEL